MAKYNWRQLQEEFTTGNWLTISQFFRDKGISNNSRNRTNARGWLESKVNYEKEVLTQARKTVIESEIEVRIRQQKASQLLQLKGLERLEDLSIQTIDEARKLIVEGMEQERQALGLDKDIQATQINVLPQGKTELDKRIENAGYEELLGMIAELKKIQKRDEKVTTS